MGQDDGLYDVTQERDMIAQHTTTRRRLPDTRDGINHKFSLSGHECYLTANWHEDGTFGELFITMAKNGSFAAGLMDTIGLLLSMAVQYGVPLPVICAKLKGMKFDPSQPGKADSMVDYIGHWLEQEFPDGRHRSFVDQSICTSEP